MALDCKSVKQIDKQCMLGVGGAKSLAVIPFADINQATVEACKASGKITESDFGALVNGTTEGVQAKVWNCLRDTLSATSSLQVNNGQRGFNHSVSGTFQGSPLKGDDALNAVLADLVFIVRDNSGVVKLYGADNGLRIESYEDATGTSQQDLNGATWTASGYQISQPLEFDGVSFDEIVAKTWNK